MAEWIVRNRRGDIDVERSSLGAVIAAEAGPPSYTPCEECGSPTSYLLDRSRHSWYCSQHPRHDVGVPDAT